MNITIEIPDEMNDELAGIKNINAFVLNALKMALATQAQRVLIYSDVALIDSI